MNGFNVGDPSIAAAGSTEAKDTTDVLIVGCGPAGLTLATQLCAFGDISVRIIERKSGPLEFGQADGIACRSAEMYEAFGFAERVIKEGYHVNEVSFWRPGADETPLVRADRIQDVEDDHSEMPHIILSQARVHNFYLENMAKSPSRLTPEYKRELVSLTRKDDRDFPIEATVACPTRPEDTETIRAKYVVGCDGARSKVRSELSLALKGESARQLWGVMDVLCHTNFPDIRLKCAVQSADQGSILVIPREGGYLVRLYIELDELVPDERAADLRGQSPVELLDTYSTERRAKAQELIDFDRDMARLFSEKPKTKKDAAQFQAYFKKHGRYTAGVETRYDASLIRGDTRHQNLATGYPVGQRFHSGPVIRLADAKPMQLGHNLKADGRWRIIIFAPRMDEGDAN